MCERRALEKPAISAANIEPLGQRSIYQLNGEMAEVTRCKRVELRKLLLIPRPQKVHYIIARSAVFLDVLYEGFERREVTDKGSG
jgi:hypothetical protein